MKKIGVIGCGVMGGAMAVALCKTAEVFVSDVNREKAEAFAEAHGCTACDTKTIVSECDWFIFAVKPNCYKDLCKQILPVLNHRKEKPLVITLMAGVTRASLAAQGIDAPILRLMPNTPAQIGQGMIPYCTDENAICEEFEELFRFAGRCDRVQEEQLDMACALSGCGPAYVCLMAEALADGAVALGFPREKAYLYAWQTLSGTAQLALEKKQHPGVLKDAVCSPGGATIQGVIAMEEGGVRAALIEAVRRAFEKSQEIGRS